MKKNTENMKRKSHLDNLTGCLIIFYIILGTKDCSYEKTYSIRVSSVPDSSVFRTSTEERNNLRRPDYLR